MLELIKVTYTEIFDMEPLIHMSLAEGYSFLKRFYDAFCNQSNLFQQENELFLIAQDEYGTIIGAGGIQTDPYAQDLSIGRIRHFYVAPAWRRMGIGNSILSALIRFGKDYYEELHVRIPLTGAKDQAALFYENMGFDFIGEQDYSHCYAYD